MRQRINAGRDDRPAYIQGVPMIANRFARRNVVACAFAALGLIPAIAGIQAIAKGYAATEIPTIQRSSGPHHEARVALVIANTEYPDAATPLQGMDSVRELAARLHTSGFTVDLQQNLTKASMGSAIERFVAGIKPGTTALISFSGYGIQADHENYMIPVDARIWTENDVRREGVNISALLSRVNEKGGAVTVAILDASRRNPFERRFRNVSSGLATIDTPRDTLVLSTAAPGKNVEDGSDLGIRAIVEEMKTPGTDAETLFNRTRQRVSLASKGSQTPYMTSSLLDVLTF